MKNTHQIFYANGDEITPAILIDGGSEEKCGMTIQILDIDTCEILMNGIDAYINIDRKNIERILWMMKSMED